MLCALGRYDEANSWLAFRSDVSGLTLSTAISHQMALAFRKLNLWRNAH